MIMTVGRAKEYGNKMVELGHCDLAGQWFDIADDIRVIGVECFNKDWLKQKEKETLEIIKEGK
ncbi:hypothetical protein TwortDSMZ_210 [Staphylococcus phage Twort]|uniref:Uncharacterized protein n=2 Tax=Staphylococcus phage Twort (strain DSM 17442 / HER 48) TaxID=2908167 RepID=A0A6H0X530_BPTWO|nr:ORF173 [Staphylococcus phage Twort]AAX92444.1 ORF173 [Staphylococcus phage Twort]QIW89030.1 hypothetical protein TwortDSMZ_021 [Staphylococcus phage Twort]QIW89201.1 hypothetical protein TwortDSMZ_210 [Staphylococcus phage Twort]